MICIYMLSRFLIPPIQAWWSNGPISFERSKPFRSCYRGTRPSLRSLSGGSISSTGARSCAAWPSRSCFSSVRAPAIIGTCTAWWSRGFICTPATLRSVARIFKLSDISNRIEVVCLAYDTDMLTAGFLLYDVVVRVLCQSFLYVFVGLGLIVGFLVQSLIQVRHWHDFKLFKLKNPKWYALSLVKFKWVRFAVCMDTRPCFQSWHYTLPGKATQRTDIHGSLI